MDKPRFRAHYNDNQPVEDGVLVEIVWFDDDFDMYEIDSGRACVFGWGQGLFRIIAYRILDDE